MNDEPIQPPVPKGKSPALALYLGFAPTALMLGMFFLGSVNLLDRIPKSVGVVVLSLLCIVSIGCCFASSFLLFKRKTGLAIFGGIMFLLLNAVISFFFGCGAVLSGSF